MVVPRKKIAVLGGGIAGLTTALELSATPELRAKYDINVYQMGWRLGGKCATGRNTDHGNRIEEHGIHGFTGAYYNALPLMKSVYEEWASLAPEDFGPDRDHPFPKFEDAFPARDSSFYWEMHEGSLKRWRIYHPPNNLTIEDAPRFGTLSSWLRVITQTFAIRDQDLDASNISEPPQTPVEGETNSTRRHRLVKAFLICLLRGLRDDDIETNGFRSIDHENFDDWLKRHGADEELLASPIVVSPINTTYQYPYGDISQPPQMSASAYLQWLLRSFVNLGHAFYLFEAGSGETLITPIYAVLKKRGVKFHFFHRVDGLHIHDGILSEISFSLQAHLKDNTYMPLIKVGKLQSWPNKPLYNQLICSDELRHIDFEDPYTPFEKPEQKVSLTQGQDFDYAVLAMPVSALSLVAQSIAKENDRWRSMLNHMPTVATQSMQRWLSKSLVDLGWMYKDPTGKPWFYLAGNFRGGPHGHVDFSKFLKYESWSGTEQPKSLLYFSGVLTDRNFSDRSGYETRDEANQRVGTECLNLLKMAGAQLLPKTGIRARHPTAGPFAFDFSILFPPPYLIRTPNTRL